jgi:hypothetical protein
MRYLTSPVAHAAKESHTAVPDTTSLTGCESNGHSRIKPAFRNGVRCGNRLGLHGSGVRGSAKTIRSKKHYSVTTKRAEPILIAGCFRAVTISRTYECNSISRKAKVEFQRLGNQRMFRFISPFRWAVPAQLETRRPRTADVILKALSQSACITAQMPLALECRRLYLCLSL